VLNVDLVGLVSSGSRWGPVVDACESGYESSGFIRDGAFVGQLRDC
jgi:hypothetical protein